MIIYQNSLMKLEYNPELSLMQVNWPNLEPYSLPEAKQALSRLVTTIRDHEIRNLLLDSTLAKATVNPDEFNEVIQEYLKELFGTKLQRIARLKSVDPERESRVETITTASNFPFEFKNFTSREEALLWLQESQNKFKA